MLAVLSLIPVGEGVSIVPEIMASFRLDRLAYRAIAGPEVAFGRATAMRLSDQLFGKGRML